MKLAKSPLIIGVPKLRRVSRPSRSYTKSPTVTLVYPTSILVIFSSSSSIPRPLGDDVILAAAYMVLSNSRAVVFPSSTKKLIAASKSKMISPFLKVSFLANATRGGFCISIPMST